MRTKSLALFIVSGFLIITFIFSCKTKKETAKSSACSGVQSTYTSDVKPLLDANCATTCHSARKKADGIDLSTYETAKETAGKKSFLGAIRHEEGYTPMPKNHPKLDEASIQKIACWVENGMKQ